MSVEVFLFFAFAAVLVAAALAVITVKNSVHAALCLVLTFFTSSALWLLMQAEFLAIALVLVYVGAVMVLFLFVVMMLDINTESTREGFIRYLPVGIGVALVMLVEMLALMGFNAMRTQPTAPEPAAAASLSNTAWLGKALFSSYLLPFEIAAVILTVAIIAAIMLTLRTRPGTRKQDPSAQVAVKARDRVRIVKMPSATGAAPLPQEATPP